MLQRDLCAKLPQKEEMLTGADPALDGPVILFQDVIEVRHRSVLAVLLQNTPRL
jgi:hypothetical protein